MCRLAGQRGIRVLCADTARLLFGDNTLHAVVCFTVLRIIPGQDADILDEIYRVLQPRSLPGVSILTGNAILIKS